MTTTSPTTTVARRASRPAVARLAVAALAVVGLGLVPTPADAAPGQAKPVRTRYFQDDAMAAPPERPAECLTTAPGGIVGQADSATCAAMNAQPVDMSAMFP